MVYESDVVVVGCGIAGLSAAVAAAQAGASVRVLERAPKADRGGNSRYTSADLRMKSVTEVTDDFVDLLVRTSSTFVHHSHNASTLKPYEEWPPVLRAYGFADPELVTAFAESAPDAIAWLKSCGVRFDEAINPTNGVPCLKPVGGGWEAVERSALAAEKLGVTFHYDTSGKSLNLDEKGAVTGVRAWSSEAGGAVDFAAKSVILASGGFEGNLEMSTKYLGPHAYRLRPVCRGGMYNKGEGIRMALDVGAAPAGSYEDFHAMIVDPRSDHPESIQPWNYGILVNVRGERFVDEGSDARTRIADKIGRDILAQPDGIAYFIYDKKIQEIENFQRQINSSVPPVRASTIEALATGLGINPAKLKATVQAFNAAVQDGKFTPIAQDGKRTVGITPPKSNWALSIDGPDFMAYPLVCTNCFTFGGVRVSPSAQVVNTEGYVIPGLYAAGEVIGMYYGAYVGSTSVLKGLVFGRIAGKHAAGQIKMNKSGASRAATASK